MIEYKVLSRKYRPKKLKEVIGQDWVADKYGEESAKDPKKEKDLQWLIDKKLRGK